jgi:hypothetical protein
VRRECGGHVLDLRVLEGQQRDRALRVGFVALLACGLGGPVLGFDDLEAWPGAEDHGVRCGPEVPRLLARLAVPPPVLENGRARRDQLPCAG